MVTELCELLTSLLSCIYQYWQSLHYQLMLAGWCRVHCNIGLEPCRKNKPLLLGNECYLEPFSFPCEEYDHDTGTKITQGQTTPFQILILGVID